MYILWQHKETDTHVNVTRPDEGHQTNQAKKVYCWLVIELRDQKDQLGLKIRKEGMELANWRIPIGILLQSFHEGNTCCMEEKTKLNLFPSAKRDAQTLNKKIGRLFETTRTFHSD